MLSLPNLLTLARLALAPFIFWAITGGRHRLALTLFAAVASIGALVAELTQAKGHGGVDRAGLAAGTVILSWLFVQVVFAMHYAHLYYLSENQSARHQGGLDRQLGLA